MLRITMNKSASGAKKYYSESYYSEGNDVSKYYSDKDQVIGIWGGKAAEKLGLRNEISKADFAALCDNLRPDNGKTLTGRTNENRSVGYDFTFNASKSVSLAYTFATETEKRNILAAFREAVADSMKEVENGMQARVRDGGKNENRETGNIAYGEFIHYTTRPVDGAPDPHLHAHCFVFNATHDETDNKWKAGQFRQIKQDAPYYEAYFHSKLAEKLQRIGYEVERTNNGLELKGVTKDTIEKFSRRTKEIEEHAREHNITDNKLKSHIGAKTRESKRVDANTEREFAEWHNRLTQEELHQLTTLKTNSSDGDAIRNSEAAKTAVQYSLDHHLERKSVTSDKEILATALKSSIGTATPEQVKQEFEKKDVVISVKEHLRTFVTTKDALSEEKKLIGNAISFKGRFAPINDKYVIKSEILNNQQRKAVEHTLSGRDGISIIAGKAGTGKTTLMLEVQKGIIETGKEIYSFAPSAEASRVVQRSEGFENAETVAHLILNKELHPKLKNQVIWIDEAGLLSNKDMNKVLDIAKEHNARVILSGDTRQHSSVERGDALRIMQKYAAITPVTISKIQRQKVNDYRQAVKFISEANVEKGFKKLDSIGAIVEIADHADRVKTIAQDYYDSSFRNSRPLKEVLVISPTHAESNVVTREIRTVLKKNNLIGHDDREFTVLRSLQYTSAEKCNPNSYRKGLILSFHQNIKGIRAGSKVEIIGTADNHVIAVDAKGEEHVIPLSKSASFNVFEVKPLEIAQGDKIRITGNGKTLEGVHLFNGSAYSVKGFDKQGNIKLSNGSVLSKNYGHFTSGYVMTSHSAQGKTADKVIISQSSLSHGASGMEQFYVSVSRGKQSVAIYTDDKPALLQVVSQSMQRLSATELMEKQAQLKQAIENTRITGVRRLAQKTIETAQNIRTTLIKGYELQRPNRTAQPGKAR